MSYEYKPPSRDKIFDDTTWEFVAALLQKQVLFNRDQPDERLGYLGVDRIKSHNFFNGIDWSVVSSRNFKSAFEIKSNSPQDLKYFDKAFT